MDLHVSKVFEHTFEGASICAGVWKSGYTAYRIHPDNEPVWFWNNANWNNEQPYKKGEWIPMFKDCEKVYEGAQCFILWKGALQYGRMEHELDDHLGLRYSECDYLCYVPRKACKRLEWIEKPLYNRLGRKLKVVQ